MLNKFLLDLVLSLGTAAVLTVVFAVVLRRVGPFRHRWPFFVIVWLTSWAAGAWTTPFGLGMWGVYWLPFVLAGSVVALILAGLGHADVGPPPADPAERNEPPVEAEKRHRVGGMLLAASFLWFALFGLILALVAHYLFGNPFL